MSTPSRRPILLVGAGALLLAGCPPRKPLAPQALPPIPLTQAVALIDTNARKVSDTLRAIGSVDGYFTIEGRRRHYSVDAVLFFLKPNHVRFDLKKLGTRQFLFGSNAEQFWFYDKEADDYFCGRRDEPDDYPPNMPLHPDQIADALALRPLSALAAGDGSTGLVQRIVDDYQQILFVVRDVRGRSRLEKEYWLDRHVPTVVRRVIFRDVLGAVELESRLNDYRLLERGGPMLPREMIAEWPERGAQMRFRVSKWTLVPQVGPDGPQFATPPECRP